MDLTMSVFFKAVERPSNQREESTFSTCHMSFYYHTPYFARFSQKERSAYLFISVKDEHLTNIFSAFACTVTIRGRGGGRAPLNDWRSKNHCPPRWTPLCSFVSPTGRQRQLKMLIITSKTKKILFKDVELPKASCAMTNEGHMMWGVTISRICSRTGTVLSWWLGGCDVDLSCYIALREKKK